jgi:hypothetical protein
MACTLRLTLSKLASTASAKHLTRLFKTAFLNGDERIIKTNPTNYPEGSMGGAICDLAKHAAAYPHKGDIFDQFCVKLEICGKNAVVCDLCRLIVNTSLCVNYLE